MTLVFWTTCVDFPRHAVDDLTDAVDRALPISRRTFLRHVDRDDLASRERALGYGHGLHMAGDPYVSYWRSSFRGIRVYWFNWSAIEHIYAPPELIHEVLA